MAKPMSRLDKALSLFGVGLIVLAICSVRDPVISTPGISSTRVTDTDEVIEARAKQYVADAKEWRIHRQKTLEELANRPQYERLWPFYLVFGIIFTVYGLRDT